MSQPSAIVIGAGIVGLATARALGAKGYSVKVFDRNDKAVGASVRNFGMIWPVGQPDGILYDRALRSRNIWKEIADDTGLWYDEVGSLHVAYHADEWQVLQELHEIYGRERSQSLLSPSQITAQCDAVVPQNCEGGLYSPVELIVDPREALEVLPRYLREKYGTEFYFGKCVSYVADNTIYIGNNEEYEADIIFICSGTDFSTLYPEVFDTLPITKCKLQMLRFAPQPGNWRIGPALCGGLSLTHYKSFAVAPSLPILKKRYENELPQYIEWGIHVMTAQNGRGELSVGDSHEYGPTHDPFDKAFINNLIVEYLKTFARFKDWTITETWNGIYPKLTNGDTEMFITPEPGVYIINGVGGAGMTLSFGFTEEITAFL